MNGKTFPSDYIEKQTTVGDDILLISDSEDGNTTKVIKNDTLKKYILQEQGFVTVGDSSIGGKDGQYKTIYDAFVDNHFGIILVGDTNETQDFNFNTSTLNIFIYSYNDSRIILNNVAWRFPADTNYKGRIIYSNISIEFKNTSKSFLLTDTSPVNIQFLNCKILLHADSDSKFLELNNSSTYNHYNYMIIFDKGYIFQDTDNSGIFLYDYIKKPNIIYLNKIALYGTKGKAFHSWIYATIENCYYYGSAPHIAIIGYINNCDLSLINLQYDFKTGNADNTTIIKNCNLGNNDISIESVSSDYDSNSVIIENCKFNDLKAISDRNITLKLYDNKFNNLNSTTNNITKIIAENNLAVGDVDVRFDNDNVADNNIICNNEIRGNFTIGGENFYYAKINSNRVVGIMNISHMIGGQINNNILGTYNNTSNTITLENTTGHNNVIGNLTEDAIIDNGSSNHLANNYTY